MVLQVPAITVRVALAGFDELGLNTTAMLRAAGVTRNMLTEPFALISDGVLMKMWTEAFNQRPDTTLPTQAGFAVPEYQFDLVDHLVETADTVGHAFQIMSLHLRFLSRSAKMEFSHGDGDWVWTADDPTEPLRHVWEQWAIASAYARFGHIPAFRVTEVHLSHPDDGDEERFAELWGVPVMLGQSRTGMRLADGVWALPNERANPPLRATLQRLADRVEFRRFEESPIVYALRQRLPDALVSGKYSAEEIAAELGLSKRSLQRRLLEENITFKELLDLHRREQALTMLQNGERDIGAISYVLGYADQSSFNRAFRRWTGTTPRLWARENAAGCETPNCA